MKNFLFILSACICLVWKKSLASSRFNNLTNNCQIDFFDATVFRGGELTITKLDKTNRIISARLIQHYISPGARTP
jgi:hypothetical protein